MNRADLRTLWIAGWIAAVIIICAAALAHARDLGQWTDPVLRDWYQNLKQPDMPGISCCGEADSYYADSFETSTDGEYVAIITDERADEPLKREHVPVGTRIVIPNNKLNRDSNPTGHGVIFLSKGGYVYCYIAPGGV